MTEYSGGGYNPVYLPGHTISLTAQNAVKAGDLLAVTGDDMVSAVPETGHQWIGVALFPAEAATRVAVSGRGPVHEHLADGSVTAGDLLIASGTAGQVTVMPTPLTLANSLAVCGIALRGAANGALCRWMAI